MDIAGILVALATLVTAIAGLFKLEQVHIKVNSRLDEALAKIASLEARLYLVTGKVPTGIAPPIR